ncbi:hypothetical protein PR202_gb06094 [Eleusine coracana subsp. coracana]|uniref:General transcription and DNA repair factor IIH subunit TFB4 n=1 Tax=Eleusine coracana subsp. coracana TaxID=191504 RepID=A0AAV5E689_ELECO|nr:hypothetical protein PR202_gb06094 [Eleusine coracana subsp. coracana]
MTSSLSKLYSDDVSLVVVVVDTNPFFWAASALPFADFFSHLIHFVNSILLLNHLNRVVVIAAGVSSCAYIFDSSDASAPGGAGVAPPLTRRAARYTEDFPVWDPASTTSGEYVAVMNSIFSAQRSSVPIDSCIVGTQDSAFLQQASYITGGVYLKPQELNGLFQYLAISQYQSTVELLLFEFHIILQSDCVFATDLHSRTFLRLPKTLGVDFRASCFCHKKTIDMGFVCSVCLSIFCKNQKKCSTCG